MFFVDLGFSKITLFSETPCDDAHQAMLALRTNKTRDIYFDGFDLLGRVSKFCQWVIPVKANSTSLFKASQTS